MEWARSLWETMHRSSFYVDRYEYADVEAQQAFKEYLTTLPGFLPCLECRKHLQAYYDAVQMPEAKVRAEGAYPFAHYVFGLHNAVNRRLSKPTYSFEQVVNYYVHKNADALCGPQGRPDTPAAPVTCEVPPLPKEALAIIVSVAVLLILVILTCATLQHLWHE